MMRNKTLGIVGYGDIAIECARMAKHGFKTRIFALKRDTSTITEEGKELADEIVGPEGLPRILAESDYILNVLPLTPETEGLFGEKEFAMMKKSAIFANIGRGKTVVEKDLVSALKDKTIRGAVLDVFEMEPLPVDSELWDMENVVNTQHSADWTTDYVDRVVNVFGSELQRFIKGEKMENIVSKETGY